MSTRCQTKVTQTGTGWDQSVTLYHHCDGYPAGMVPLFKKAYDAYGLGWEAGRAGHVASFLCATDPEGFEPEEGHRLHGDIEYYYVLEVQNSKGGSTAERPEWILSVYDVPFGCESVESMTLLAIGKVAELDGEAIEATMQA